MHLTHQQLSAQLDQALQGASLQLVERHLGLCEKCRDELAAITLQDRMLAEALTPVSNPETGELIALEVRCELYPQKAKELEERIDALTKQRALLLCMAEEAAAHAAPEEAQAEVEEQVDAEAREQAEAKALLARAREEAAAREKAEATAMVTRARLEAAALAKSEAEARKRAEAEARAKAEAEARQKAEAEAEAEARARADAVARARAEAEARATAEAEARQKAEQESRAKAAAEARRKAEEETRRKAEAEAARAAEKARAAALAQTQEIARTAAAEAARLRAAEEARLRAEIEANVRAEVESRLRAEFEARAATESRAREQAEKRVVPPQAVTVERIETVLPRETHHTPRRHRPRRTAWQHTRRVLRPLATGAFVVLVAFNVWIAIENGALTRLTHRASAVIASREPTHTGDRSIGPIASPPVPVITTSQQAREPSPAPSDSTPHVAALTEPSPTPLPTPKPRPIHVTSAAPPRPPSATVIESRHQTSTEVVRRAAAVELGLLCGAVRDPEAQPISGARIIMADVGVTVVTDRRGRFCLTAPKGDRTMSVTAQGYQPWIQTISIGRETDELAIVLHFATLARPDSSR